MQATTDNYYAVAVKDDTEVEKPRTAAPVGDKAARSLIRQERMQAAVERSRSEYRAEHAYTEHMWYTQLGDTMNNSGRGMKPKMNLHNLEYLVTSLYYASPPEYAQALDKVLAAFDPKAKALGNLSKEVVQTGMDCALQLRERNAAVVLAESTRSLWKSQAGLTCSAGRCFLLADRLQDALIALLAVSANLGLHVPILQLLCDVVDRLRACKTDEQGGRLLDIFNAQLQGEIHRQNRVYERGLGLVQTDERNPSAAEERHLNVLPTTFSSRRGSALESEPAHLATCLGLPGESAVALARTVRRLQRDGAADAEEPDSHGDRGVRQL